MAEDTKFKRISINAAPEDDVVIFAGNNKNAEGVTGDYHTYLDAHDNVVDFNNPDTAHIEDKDINIMPAETKQTQSFKQQPTYHETTLEDIESSKMSSMQKVVIIVAVIAVVAFLFWFLG